MTPAQRLGVAQGNNRLNSSGGNIGNVLARSSQQIANIVPPNSTLPIPANGSNFYVMAASAAINIRPKGGVFNSYTPGTGLEIGLDNAFDLIEVQNTTANPISFLVFVGFQGYIDKRLFLSLNNTPTVAFPTNPTAGATTNVNINDLSGAAFTDINGGKWYAVARVALIVSNTDTGVTLLLQQAAGTGTSPAIAAIYPQTSLRLEMAGNYSLNVGGGAVNAIVSELYQAIAAI